MVKAFVRATYDSLSAAAGEEGTAEKHMTKEEEENDTSILPTV